MSHTEPILVPIAPGELVDKITILEIKCERIGDDLKRANVERELALLGEVRASQIELSDTLTQLTSELKTVNETLWQIEDDIRSCERDRNFGPNFIELARSVYIHNDRRAQLKRAINISLGSDLVEEKSYADYSTAVHHSSPNSESPVNMSDAVQLLEQGNVFYMHAQFSEAETCYRQACALENNHFEAANNLGVVLAEQGRNEEATDWYRRAIECNRRYFEAHFNLGNALRSLRKWDEACASYQRALEIQPGTPAALTNLALAHSWAGRVAQAVECYQLAIAADPHHAGAHNGLGLMFQRLGRLEDAQQCFNHAVELDPQLPEPHVNRAQLWLLQQRLPEGFREFQWRWRLPGRAVSAGMPQWNGEPIEGRRVLLWMEQGVGDAIMLLRFAQEVRNQGAYVLFQCSRRLHALLGTCPFIDRICEGSEGDLKADYHCPLFDLPRLLGTTMESIPQNTPYLSAGEDRTSQWSDRLSKLPGFKIGIAWQGSRDYPEDCHRSIPLSCFAPLASIRNVTLIGLQMENGRFKEASDTVVQSTLRAVPATVPGCSLNLVDWSDEIDRSGAFVDTAAILTQLDLVITCDTSLGHLAGALGVPVWIALSTACDWRWFTGRTGSPWYRTARLYRQTRLDDWQPVFEQMARDTQLRISACAS